MRALLEGLAGIACGGVLVSLYVLTAVRLAEGTAWDDLRRGFADGLRAVTPRRPAPPRADHDAIRRMEMELGVYRPAGEDLFACPRCDGPGVACFDPSDGGPWGSAPLLCAPCSVEVLEEHGNAVREEVAVGGGKFTWLEGVWECCQDRHGERRCWSGGSCTHRHWRTEAARLWRMAPAWRDERRAREEDRVAEARDHAERVKRAALMARRAGLDVRTVRRLP